MGELAIGRRQMPKQDNADEGFDAEALAALPVFPGAGMAMIVRWHLLKGN